MKRIFLIVIIFLSACTSVSANSSKLTEELVATNATQPANATPGPTDLFITQVMATKYAARTAYAAIPTITPTPTIPAASPDCRPADLQISFHTNGATGNIVLELGVTNIGNSACFLPSWPAVLLIDRSGKTLDVMYDYAFLNANPSSLPPTQESNPGEPILYGMEKNQTAGLELLWGNWCGGAIQGGVVIRMYLLQTDSWIDISTDIGGGGRCDEPSAPSTIAVVGFGY